MSDDEADALLPHVTQCAACHDALDRFRRESLDSRVLRTALRAENLEKSKSQKVEMGTAMIPAVEGRLAVGDRSPTPEGWGTKAGGSALSPEWAIPDYERVRLCGEGAFGTVWAVRDRVGVHRALKTIDLERLAARGVRCRESTALEAYCRMVGRHPNLIEVFHVGIQGQQLYYTMELADDAHSRRAVRGEVPADYRPLTLQSVIAQGPAGVDTAIEVILRLLRGLSRLHALGLAHRDIKPSNVVFVGRRPKLADIGMITSDTESPSQVGTPAYMPPDRKMDPTADVYAMGRMLYELLVGGAGEAFPRLPVEVLRSRDRWDMDRVQSIIQTACAAEAPQRYAHAGRMLEELEACRELSYESLFGDLARAERGPARADDAYRPYILAGIHALPWVLGLTLAIMLVHKLL